MAGNCILPSVSQLAPYIQQLEEPVYTETCTPHFGLAIMLSEYGKVHIFVEL